MRLHRRQLSLWAARLLFAWLFCTGMGMAKACLSTAPVGHAYPAHAAQAGEPATGDHAGCAGEDGATPDTHCQSFCDQAGISIPKSKASFDDVQAPPLALLWVASALQLPDPLALRLPPPCRTDVRAPPIPITFLRLTL